VSSSKRGAMVPLFSFSVKYEEAVGRVVGWHEGKVVGSQLVVARGRRQHLVVLMAGTLRFAHPAFRGCAQSTNVVSCAPSSATNTAINSAGSVVLALAETRCTAPGGSKNDWPTLNVSTGPPASCERISPLVM
jgi:hypothetical protein